MSPNAAGAATTAPWAWVMYSHFLNAAVRLMSYASTSPPWPTPEAPK